MILSVKIKKTGVILMVCSTNQWKLIYMAFPERLAIIRKDKGFTQQMMSDKVGIHVSQYKRYEAGSIKNSH
jgi:predicted enzyme involved in methoxymalonyl-ACP biosynthesis